MERKLTRRQALKARSLIILVAIALVAAAFTVTACTSAKKTEPAEKQHPTIGATQTCDSCKEAPEHTHQHQAPYTGACDKCHTTSSWRIVRYSHTDANFNMSMHGVIGCSACHKEGESKLPSADCETCHQKRSPHKGKSQHCAQCHTPLAWSINRPVPKGHVSLEGGHAGLSCFMCHTASARTGKARTCVDCHGTNHGGLTRCQDCHDPSTYWKPKAGFDHSAFFMLEGRHAKLQCTACHKNGRFAGTPKTCVGCHGVHHGGLTDCAKCHTPKNFSWAPKAGFDHSVFFKLQGRHLLVQCAQCHPNGRFAGTPRKCVGCHGNHHGISTLTDCVKCHSPLVSWTPVNGVNHDAFPLTGKHKTVACSKCHADGIFAGKSHACVSCHGVHHGGLTDCASCHTTAGFDKTSFDHSTKLVLQGAHATMPCSNCHPNNLYATLQPSFKGNGPACTDCHATRHGAAFTSCASCHTMTAFVPTKAITHPAPIVLGPEHASRSCKLCHPTLLFADPTTPCVTCHASTIPHVGPTDCLSCHRPTTWSEVHFTHIAFPFHVTDQSPHPTNSGDCSACHTTGDYTTYSCDACHAPGTVTPTGPVTAGVTALKATLRTLQAK